VRFVRIDLIWSSEPRKLPPFNAFVPLAGPSETDAGTWRWQGPSRERRRSTGSVTGTRPELGRRDTVARSCGGRREQRDQSWSRVGRIFAERLDHLAPGLGRNIGVGIIRIWRGWSGLIWSGRPSHESSPCRKLAISTLLPGPCIGEACVRARRSIRHATRTVILPEANAGGCCRDAASSDQQVEQNCALASVSMASNAGAV
jgi:hypothetical protein